MKKLMCCLIVLVVFTVLGPARAASTLGDDAFRIVSPQWLNAHLQEDDLIILDVRRDVSDYQHGHIPGAVFLPDDVVRLPKGGLPVQYAPEDIAEKIFSRAGVEDDDVVVVYSEGENVLGASMVIYALRRIGHERTALLDGGFSDYQNQFPVTQLYPDVEVSDYDGDLDEDLFITFDDLVDELAEDDPEITLLDVRPAKAYVGDTQRWIRNGHIPGAINSDWHQLMEPSNFHKIRPVDRMRTVIQATGVEPDDDIVLYCGTSREATLSYLLMKHVLGYDNVRLYEGSWTEYCSKPDMPVQTGPLPGTFPAEIEVD